MSEKGVVFNAKRPGKCSRSECPPSEGLPVIDLKDIPDDKPVLIAGPTASGKSALALAIAADKGGLIINADALQVFDGWRILTARPSPDELAIAPHALYGHVPYDAAYSVGHWLRDVEGLLRGPERPIIVGGTGLYFRALTEGLGGDALTHIICEETHTCYTGDRKTRHDWGYGCGSCPACELRGSGYRRWEARNS